MESKIMRIIANFSHQPQTPTEYFIGVDTYDKDFSTYSLVQKTNDRLFVLLSKTIRDKNEFKGEVDNLSKYFNAPIMEEN